MITKYNIKWLDFDIEYGETSGQSPRRAQALAALQKANPGLIVSYTLPLGPGGLDSGDGGGTGDITDAKAAGLNLTICQWHGHGFWRNKRESTSSIRRGCCRFGVPDSIRWANLCGRTHIFAGNQRRYTPELFHPRQCHHDVEFRTSQQLHHAAVLLGTQSRQRRLPRLHIRPGHMQRRQPIKLRILLDLRGFLNHARQLAEGAQVSILRPGIRSDLWNVSSNQPPAISE